MCMREINKSSLLTDRTVTGKAPTLAEFKASFPRIVWTYQEEV